MKNQGQQIFKDIENQVKQVELICPFDSIELSLMELVLIKNSLLHVLSSHCDNLKDYDEGFSLFRRISIFIDKYCASL